MNRIRAWIVRVVFGKAQSEAPGDGQMREEHPDWRPKIDIECPECEMVIPVRIEASLENSCMGDHELTLTPDMTDLWAHSFTHERET